MYNKIIKGLLSGSAGLIITLVIQVISAPILIRYWGVDRYADWLVLLTVPAFLSVSDLGIVNVFSNCALKEYANENYIKFKKYIGTSIHLVIPLSISLSFLFSSVIAYYSDVDVMNDNYIFYLLVFYSSLMMISSLSLSTWRSVNRFATGSILYDTARLIEFISLIIIVVFGGNEVSALFFLIILRLISISINIYLLCLKCEILELEGKIKFDRKIFNDNIKNSLFYFMIPSSNMMLSQGSIIILSNTVSPAALVFFNTSRVMLRLMNSVSAVLSNAWRVDLSRLYFKNEFSDFLRMKKKLIFFNVIITMIGSLFFLLFGEKVYFLWMGETVQFDNVIYCITLLTVILASLYRPYMMLISSLNKHDSFAKIFPAIVILGLLFMGSFGGNLYSFLYLFLIELSILTFLFFVVTNLSKKNRVKNENENENENY